LRRSADDYIVKPFDVDDLILRMQNISSRSNPDLSNENQLLKPVLTIVTREFLNHLLRNAKYPEWKRG
jgi:DNA-binding response OmpR family regulator